MPITYFVVREVILCEVGVFECLFSSGSAVWVHCKQLIEQVDGTRVGAKEEFVEVLPWVGRQGGKVCLGLWEWEGS